MKGRENVLRDAGVALPETDQREVDELKALLTETLKAMETQKENDCAGLGFCASTVKACAEIGAASRRTLLPDLAFARSRNSQESTDLIQQGTEADLVENPLAREGLDQHPDHETKHGEPPVQELCTTVKAPPAFAIWAGTVHPRFNDSGIKQPGAFGLPHASL